MIYQLSVRPLTENDVNVSCPFLPEEDELSVMINSFVEDISNLSQVKETKHSDFTVEIQLSSNVSEDRLKELVKPMLKEFFCYIRFVSLVLIK